MTPDTAAVERAPAKVNLHLAIMGREPDGYHTLETLFQALELHDSLELHPTAESADALDVTGSIDVGATADNLVLRAARAYREAAPATPAARFVLHKRIPAGAGLGGGSSDAAAALRLLDRRAETPLGPERLREIGASVGADVPFFLCGSPLARAWDRGDRLVPLAPLASAPVVVVDPGFPVATRDAFGWWDERPTDRRFGVSVNIASFQSIGARCRNDFEDVVFERHPVLARIRDLIEQGGALIARLSGSGSCTFGVFPDDARAADTAARIEADVPGARVLLTRTLGAV